MISLFFSLLPGLSISVPLLASKKKLGTLPHAAENAKKPVRVSRPQPVVPGPSPIGWTGARRFVLARADR
jgi:hypothetical protein